jgi:Xaa-Pro aminopeptidase
MSTADASLRIVPLLFRFYSPSLIHTATRAQHKKRFNVQLKSKLVAFDAIKPGAKCSDIDRACNKVIRDAGMGDWLKHHTGHGIGLQGHEPPWIDEGDDTVLQPGMVFSIEPGLFLKEENLVYHNHEY